MLRVASLLILLAALMCTIALAQAPTGIITGTLTDESGAVIPNATVMVRKQSPGLCSNSRIDGLKPQVEFGLLDRNALLRHN